MHVFVTGATGWVGSVVVDELLAAGHRVSGLARSADKGAALAAKGAALITGTLDDLDLLTHTAEGADAVVHTAFNHDFANFAASAAQDHRAIETFGDALQGTDKPLLVTSGVALLAPPGRVATEADVPTFDPSFPRRSEVTAREWAAKGVRAATVRLSPSVHGVGDQGFMRILIDLARRKGVSAYIGDGQNRWPAVHRLDAGTVYRLILERGVNEAAYHVVAEDGVPFRSIAEVIGRRLRLPVEARGPEHFEWFARFAGADMPAASAHTRQWLGWQPTRPGLLADLDQEGYFAA